MAEMKKNNLNRFQKFLIGAAFGDAIGKPVEGQTKKIAAKYINDIFQRSLLLNRIRYNLTGQVTDDTQLTICLAETLLEEKPFQPDAVMKRMAERYSNHQLLGIGASCAQAFDNYLKNPKARDWGAPTGQAGNGAAIRVGLCQFPHKD